MEVAAGSWLPRGKSPLSRSFGEVQVGRVNTMGDMSREEATVAGIRCDEITCSQQINTQRAEVGSSAPKQQIQSKAAAHLQE